VCNYELGKERKECKVSTNVNNQWTFWGRGHTSTKRNEGELEATLKALALL
jgi:hypothetical protein